MTFIHPFDDPLVIAGQGTVGAEILRQQPGRALDAVFVPVGGGGLIAGIAGYIKALRPEVRVIGVEPFEADAMYQLAAGRAPRAARPRRHLRRRRRRARGRRAHRSPSRSETVDEIVRVNNDEICAAIKDVFDDTRTILEPAGALAVAGLKRWVAARRAPREQRSSPC